MITSSGFNPALFNSLVDIIRPAGTGIVLVGLADPEMGSGFSAVSFTEE
mgnify:FL=1